MSARGWVGGVIVAALGTGTASAADVEWVSLAAVVSEPNQAPHIMQFGFHRWSLVDAPSASATEKSSWAVRDLYPVWVTFGALASDPVVDHVALERVGWGDDRSHFSLESRFTVRGASWEPTDTGWSISFHLPDASLAIDLRRSAPPVRVVERDVHPGIEVIATVTRGDSTATLAGRGWWEIGASSYDELRHREGEDVLFFATPDGDAVALSRSRDSRVGERPSLRGVFVGAKGTVLELDPLGVHFYPLGRERWRSPDSGHDYPLRWRLEIPAIGLRCDIAPLRDDQEVDGSGAWGATLWRGAVRVFGWRDEVPVLALGTLELSGYGGSFPPAALAEAGDRAHAGELRVRR